MQFKNLFTFALFGSAMAVVVEKRDASTLKSVITTLGNSANTFDNTLKNYNGAQDNKILMDGVTKLNADMASAIKTVQASQPINTFDLFSLQEPAQSATNSISRLIDTLDSKKPAFKEAGITGYAVAVANMEKASTVKLTNEIVKKMPASVQSYGKPITDRITSSFDRFFETYEQ